MDIDTMRLIARKSPCKVIKFSASDGRHIVSYNGEFYSDCVNCNRTEIEQINPECLANHAEWGVLAKASENFLQLETMYIYCMSSDGKDYQFKRFWCRTCAIMLPMFGIKDVYMWNEGWIHHEAKTLIEEVKKGRK